MTQDHEKSKRSETVDISKQLADLRAQQLPAVSKRIDKIFADADAERSAQRELPQKTPVAQAAEGVFQQETPLVFGSLPENGAVSGSADNSVARPDASVGNNSPVLPGEPAPGASPVLDSTMEGQKVMGTRRRSGAARTRRDTPEAVSATPSPDQASDARLEAADEGRCVHAKRQLERDGGGLIRIIEMASSPDILQQFYDSHFDLAKGGFLRVEERIDGYKVQSEKRKEELRKKAAELEKEIVAACDEKKRVLEEAAKKNEQGLIVLGKYRDDQGVLCEVREEGGKYFYTPLEGSDKGQQQPSRDAGETRALVKEWTKVDDATEPTPEPASVTSPATPDATTPTAPDATTRVEAPTSKVERDPQNYDELFQGDVWALYDGEGKLVQAVKIGVLFEYPGTGKMANVYDLDKDLKQTQFRDPENKDTKESGIPLAHDYKLEDLRTELREKGYVLEKRGTVSEKTIDEAAIEKAEEEPLLAVGEQARYYVPELKAEYAVERTADGYHFFNDTYDSGIYTEEQMKQTILDAKWELVAGSRKAAEAKETPAKPEEATAKEVGPEGSGGLQVIEQTAEEKHREFMDGLLTEVKEARFAYVDTDYKQGRVWKKVTGVIGGLLGKERNDLDTESAKGRYNQALMKLQDAQLGELKNLGLSGKELRKRMGEMLQYYKYDERISLFEDRTRVEAENKKLPGKVMDFFENIGKRYKDLTPKQKIAFAVGVLGTSALLGLTGGAAGAAAGAGLMGIRRAIATLGAGVGTDMLAGQGAEWLRKRSATKEQEKEMEELRKMTTEVFAPDDKGVLKEEEVSHEEAYEKLNAFLTKDIGALDKKFQSQKREKFWRKTIVWGTAIGASSYFTIKAGMNLFGSHPKGNIDDFLRSREAATGTAARHMASAPDHAVSAPMGAASAAEQAASSPALAASAAEHVNPAGSPVSGMSPQELAHFQEVNMADPADGSVVSPEMTASMVALREDYTVTAADDKKGLWGILERQLPADMPKGEKNIIIARLEGKLHGMSPDQLKEAGFRTENINKIYPGDKLTLGKLLTPEEIRSAFEGHGTEGVSHAGSEISYVDTSGVKETVTPIPAAEVAPTEASHTIDPMDQAVFEEKVSRLAEQPMTPLDQPVVHPDPTAAVREDIALHGTSPVPQPFETMPTMKSIPVSEVLSPQEFADPARLGQFMAEHPELGRPYQHTLIGMKTAVFSLPQNINRLPYIEQMDGGMTGRIGLVKMERALETSWELSHGVISPYEYDTRPFPFKSSQVMRLARLTGIASHPNVFGPLGVPLHGETVRQYMERMAALATALHKERVLVSALFSGK